MLRKWLGIDSEVQELRGRLASVEEERDRLRSQYAQFSAESQSKVAQIARLETELRTTKEKLREQTDADLLLVSARIIAATLRGEKPAPADLVLQQSLAAQQRALMHCAQPYSGILSSLGIGNALGTIWP
jgi:septal ring factor EnvC (AmiA/AmiB activator)